MKTELENNRLLLSTYGNLVPSEANKGRKWTNKHFETTNGINVVARSRNKGRGVNIKNKRPTKAIGDDIADVFKEAKSAGFDTKVMRQVLAIRRQDHASRQEQEAILDLYLNALGMV